MTLSPAEFDALRGRYPTSRAVRRRNEIDVRFISAESPHLAALAVEPTVEEAYLYLSCDEAAAAAA
jgi:hypothetical protein